MLEPDILKYMQSGYLVGFIQKNDAIITDQISFVISRSGTQMGRKK